MVFLWVQVTCPAYVVSTVIDRLASTIPERIFWTDLDPMQECLEVLEPKRATSGYRLCSVARPEQPVRTSGQRTQD
jgi:hypothetical protein